MDLTNQLLNLLRDAIWSLRFFVGLLIVVSFAKTALTLWINYKIKKLEHKSTYQIVFNGSHRALNITSADRIEFEKIERHLTSYPVLIDEQDKKQKVA